MRANSNTQINFLYPDNIERVLSGMEPIEPIDPTPQTPSLSICQMIRAILKQFFR